MLFEETDDYEKYLELLSFYKKKFDVKILAYCLMSNHVHLLIYTPNTPIATFFRGMNTCYATWFNRKYERQGVLYEGRYYSAPVLTERQLLGTLRYIHYNPCKAGLEPAPGIGYAWNSYNDYLNNLRRLVDTRYIMQILEDEKNFIAMHYMDEYDEEYFDVNTTRKRTTDVAAKRIMIEECGCKTVAEFQKLSEDEKRQGIVNLNKRGICVRQLNRLTGMPRGVIKIILEQ